MNLPTDTELAKRALEIAQKDFDDNGSSEGLAGIYAATCQALRIDRESYRLFMWYVQKYGTSNQVDAHLTTLRTRLGITE